MKGSVKLPVFIDDARKLVNTTQLRAKYLGATYEAEYCQWQTLHGLGSLMETASLIITPNAYLEGKLLASYPPDPIGDMSVTRATTATRVNSAGLVELVPYNLLTWSEDLTLWTANAQIATTQLVFNPLTGKNNATKITKVTSAGDPWVVQTNAAGDGTYTYSFYLWTDAGQPTDVTLFLYNSAVSEVYTLAITLTTTPTRYEYTSTFASTGGAINARVDLSATATNQYIYAYAGQLVEGSVAKDYQKTETRLNIPRLDYSNGTCPSLLVEPQRTNLLTYSSSFDNAAWAKSGITITANNIVSPNGIQDADLSTATNGAELLQIQSLSTNTQYTFSFYVKKGTASDAKYRVYNFDSGINVVAPTSYISQTSTSEWVRVSVTFTSGASGTNYGIYLIDSASAGTMYFWGAQLEAGSYATSYIPTTSASVTRNADVISKTGISSLIGQTEGTLFVQIKLENVNSNSVYAAITDGSFTNAILIGKESGVSPNKLLLYINASGTNILFNTSTSLSSDYIKCAIAYKSGNWAAYVNGSLIASGSSTFSFNSSLNRFGFANEGSLSTNIEKIEVKSSALWKTRLTNTQLAAITSL